MIKGRLLSIVITSISTLALLQCTSKEPFYSAPGELDAYVQKFVEEGKRRGLSISLEKEGLLLKFGDLEGQKVGRCRPNDYPKEIVIDRKRWMHAYALEREVLVFHELAHCVLQRDHRDEKLPHGECASIMNSKENDFACSKNWESKVWRDYYLDELFNPEVSLPEWYEIEKEYFIPEAQKNYVVHLLNPKVTYGRSTQLGIDDTLEIDRRRDYQVEVVYHSPTKSNLYLSWDGVRFNIVTNSSGGSSEKIFNVDIGSYQQIMQNVHFPLKLTIRSQKSFLYFFVNENFLHQIDMVSSIDPRARVNIIAFSEKKAHLEFSFAYLQ